jgi:hypothetical protein
VPFLNEDDGVTGVDDLEEMMEGGRLRVRLADQATMAGLSDRTAFLAEVCAGDTVLRQEAESLLAQTASGDFLAEPIDRAAQRHRPSFAGLRTTVNERRVPRRAFAQIRSQSTQLKVSRFPMPN